MSRHAIKFSRTVSLLDRAIKFFGVTSDRVYILPTWYCLLFNSLLLILFIASFPLRNPILLVLVFSLIFIQLLSMVETHINLREIEVKPSADYLVETGQQSEIPIHVSSRESSFGLNFSILDMSNPRKVFGQRSNRRMIRKTLFKELKFALYGGFWAERVVVEAFYTVSRDSKIIRLSFMSKDRGCHKLPPVVVTSFFPFGLFRAIRILSLDATYVSYPRPRGAKMKAESADQIATLMQNAGRIANANGADDYVFHREFIAGDPLRRIDWKASSRRGVKMVKVFGASGFIRGDVFRWQDTLAQDDEGRLSELAFSVLNAAKEGLFFSLELPHHKTSVASGESHIRDCLRLLATFRREDGSITG